MAAVKPAETLIQQARAFKSQAIDCMERCDRDFEKLRSHVEHYIAFQYAADVINEFVDTTTGKYKP